MSAARSTAAGDGAETGGVVQAVESVRLSFSHIATVWPAAGGVLGLLEVPQTQVDHPRKQIRKDILTGRPLDTFVDDRHRLGAAMDRDQA